MLELIDFVKSHVFAVCLAFLTALIGFVFEPALKRKSFDPTNIVHEDLHFASRCDGEASSDDNYLLSLVIPAYNEEERLPQMLESTIGFLQSSKGELLKQCQKVLKLEKTKSSIIFEIVVVNDGSTDGTISSLYDFVRRHRESLAFVDVKLVTLKRNSGKGAAVKAGMIYSKSSKLALMLDADGATAISSLTSLLNDMIASQSDVVFGSRAHLAQKSKVERSFVRTLLMNAFHFFVSALIGGSIKDTQCGFKLFRGESILPLFGNLHLQRWAFDTELVAIISKLGYKISEVGVDWHEVDGSKLNTSKFTLVKASIGMLRDMICVRACYSMGIWKLKTQKKLE